MKLSKIVLGLILTFVFLEILTYFPELYWGKQFYIPSALNRSIEVPKIRPGTSNGAVGLLPNKEKIKILALGPSVLEGKNVAFKDHWLENLAQSLGNTRVDNFAIGWTSGEAMISKINDLIEKGERYNIVIIQGTWFRKHLPYLHQTLHYSFRWVPDPKYKWRTYSLFKKWYQRKSRYEDAIINQIIWAPNDREIASTGLKEEIRSYFSRIDETWNGDYRNSDFVKNNLVELPRILTSEGRKREIEEKTKQSIDNMMKEIPLIADHFIWIPVHHAYFVDKKIEEKIPLLFTKSVKQDDGSLKFLSAKGMERYFGIPTMLTKNYLATNYPQTIVFDFYQSLSSDVYKTNELLFSDELHLNERGHQRVGELAIPLVKRILGTKNQNK